MAGIGGGAPGPGTAGFGEAGRAMTIFMRGKEAARTFAANVELRVEDLDADAVEVALVLEAVVFVRPRRAGRPSVDGGRACSGDVTETAKLSSLPGSVPTKPGGGGGAREAIASRGAAGDAVWG